MNTDRFKFRVWDNAENEYLQEGALLDSRTGNIAGYFPDDNFIIEQCTGLTDKNGKLIFEGDVLQVPGQKLTYKVLWGRRGFVMKVGLLSAHGYPLGNTEALEIIGNIHEMTK